MADKPAPPDVDSPAPEAAEKPDKPTGEISATRIKAFDAIYRGIWSDEAPPGYLESAAAAMNLVEFGAHERSKPAYIYSPEYSETQESLASTMLADLQAQSGRPPNA